MVCSEYPAWSGDHSHHVGIINRTLANRLSKSWQSSCDHNGREMVDQSYGME